MFVLDSLQKYAGKSVLMVDGDEKVRDSMRMFFEGEGLRFTAQPDARAGLAELVENDFDIVMLDYRLKGMNGLEFLKEIQKSHPTILKIFTTTLEDPKLFSKARKLGALCCIEKPLTAEKIDHCLSQVPAAGLDRRQEATK